PALLGTSQRLQGAAGQPAAPVVAAFDRDLEGPHSEPGGRALHRLCPRGRKVDCRSREERLINSPEFTAEVIKPEVWVSALRPPQPRGVASGFGARADGAAQHAQSGRKPNHE